MSLNEQLDKRARRDVRNAHRHHGEDGQYLVGEATTGVRINASFNESPASLVDMPGGYGHQSVRREAMIGIAVLTVASPAIDDVVVIARGVYAGRWRIFGIESRDDAETMVHARLEKAKRSNADGAVVNP